MLISLDWIRDYVDLPRDIDPHELGERLTVITAEVEDVEQVSIDASGLIIARVQHLERMEGAPNLKAVTLDIGGTTTESVSAAPMLRVGDKVVFAPPGASVSKLGTINESTVASRPSRGMILPGDALGMELAAQDAVFVGPELQPGDSVPEKLFDDWVVEIDNKSLTHRPDLWGHYGIAREIAAIYGLELKPYPGVELESLLGNGLGKIPIEIADGDACRRYSGVTLEGVPTQPAPLWMQLRLGRIGLRPISGLVDLTNYIMTDLGQPMHAFDAAKVRRIEVDWAKDGDRFTTLDGTERKLTASDLMILSAGEPVAIAGVMGGMETEVDEATKSLLLESANFDPAAIRRTANRLGLRTDASARFEKSLDPAHTTLAIQRFCQLARDMYADLTITSRLSDGYPNCHPPVTVAVNPRRVSRMIGTDIPLDRARGILRPLGFEVREEADAWCVEVPSFRATNDISIDADVIEELARYVGYQSIEPAMPLVAMRRFEANPLHALQKDSLRHLTATEGFNEIFGYLWYDSAWLRQLGVDPGPCVELRNPAAEGLERFRKSLMPGMLASTMRNRFHFPSISLVELGSVFEPGHDHDAEHVHVGLICAARGKKVEDQLLGRLKAALESWSLNLFTRSVSYGRAAANADQPWEHPQRTASVMIDERPIGRLSVIDAALKRRMDEHLAAWSIGWAEIRLDDLVDIVAPPERLGGIPEFPLVEMDFSITIPAATAYNEVASRLSAFGHPLHRLTRFVDSYEGKSVGDGKRSLTFRVVAGDERRTLSEDDCDSFRGAFETHLKGCGYEIRA